MTPDELFEAALQVHEATDLKATRVVFHGPADFPVTLPLTASRRLFTGFRSGAWLPGRWFDWFLGE